VASASTPVFENIAPMRVVILYSQLLLGCVKVTWSFVGETALASFTTSIPAFREMVQSVFTRLMLKTASSAVNGAPLVNVAFETRSKVYVVRSGDTVQDVARSGTIVPSLSSLTSPS